MDSSVQTEIERLQQAKTDIKVAINNCGVGVGDDELIDAYAAYINAIPSAVLSDLNVDSIGGANSYIKTISQTNGVISATAGGLVSTSAEGLAPAIPTTAPSQINSLDKDWVLTYDDGTLGWRKLPSNAFNNNTYTALKNPTSIKFSDMSGTTVSYDGSSALDLSGGTYNSYQSNRIKVKDTRNDNDYAYLSTDCLGAVSWHFKISSQIDLPETGYYSGLLHLSPWTDYTGGPEHQLAFNNNGYIYHRLGTGIWSSWKRLAYTSDVLDVKKATTTSVGGVIVSNVSTSAVSLTSANGTTDDRYYGVQMDKDGKAFVNVPWVQGSYTLPTASASTLGGIKVGDNLTITNGKLSAVKTQVYIAPDYTSGVKIGSITVDDTSYNLYIPTPASVFVGAKASQAGTSGLVPQPVSGDHTKFLKGDGTWATPTNTWRDIKCDGTSIGANTLNLKAGSNITLSTSNGDITIDAQDTRYMDVSTAASGLAPIIPSASTTVNTIGAQVSEWVLTSDGGSIPTWKKLPVNAFLNDVTEYQVVSSTADGLMSVALKNKLDSIETSAEVNVQSDWNETKTDSDAFIKNKPTIGSGTITVKVNNSQVGTFNVNQTGATTINIPDTQYAVVSSSANGLTPMPPNSVDSSISSQANDWVLSVQAGTDPSWKKLPPTAFLNDTVDSAANHYTPSQDSTLSASASTTTNPNSTSASWGSTQIVTGVSLNKDSKGHVTGISVNSVKMPSNPNTWREIKVNGTSLLGSASNTGSINFIAGTNVVLSTEVTGAIKINATDTQYAVVSTAGDGIAPQLNTGITATISTQASELVLTSDGGERPTWKLLPTNAFNNTNYYPIRSYTSGLQISTYSGSTNCALYVPEGTTSKLGVVKQHKADNCTTYTSDEGATTPAAVKKAITTFVSVTPSLKSGTTVGTITVGDTTQTLYCQTNTNTAHSHSAGDGIILSGSGGTSGTTTISIGTATTSALGGIKVAGTTTSTVSPAVGTTANRYYGVQMDSAGQTFVNVPWTNSTYNVYSKALTSGFATSYRTQTKGNTNNGWYISTIRSDSTLTNCPAYGTGLAFGSQDTHGYLYAHYNAAEVYIGAGNADKLNWTKKLAFADGTGASGTWGIDISGTSGTVKGSYTGSGGKKNPNYFGTNKVGFLMMNTTVNNNSQYKDWIIMDCYSANDVGGGVAFGVNRQSLGAYIMRSAAERTSWAESAELIGTHNYTSYLGYIGKTAVQSSSAIQALTGMGNITPGNNNTYNIGATGNRWKYIYATEMYATTAFYQDSDQRLKQNVQTITDSILDQIYNINEVSFIWKESKKSAFGYIAQKYQNISDSLVTSNEDGILSLNYTEVLVLQIASLKKKIKDLENRLNLLENF